MVIKKMKVKINRHADDFALSLSTSKIIYDLCLESKLDSISLMPNMSCYDKVKEMTKVISNMKIPISVHLNILEGKCVSNPKLIPNLVTNDGYFKNTWEMIFLMNFNFFESKKIKKQIKIEILSQIKKVQDIVDVQNLCIDSHQHVHMIPLVFDALVEVVNENGFTLNYLRVTKEPLAPFLKEISLYKTYQPINFVKNFILNIFSIKLDRFCLDNNIEKMYAWGLIMSGEMDYSRISVIMPNVLKNCEKEKRNLEMIFHPGLLDENEASNKEFTNSDKKFYLSKNRIIEFETLRMLTIKKN